jgi:hypothetical protein
VHALQLIMGTINIDVGGKSVEAKRAYLAENTAFIFTQSGQNPIKISGQPPYTAQPVLQQQCMTHAVPATARRAERVCPDATLQDQDPQL